MTFDLTSNEQVKDRDELEKYNNPTLFQFFPATDTRVLLIGKPRYDWLGKLMFSDVDMEFVQKFTPLDFQAKNFTPSISPNFNSFSDKNTKK